MARLRVAIKGTGRYLPSRVVPNSYFEQHLDTSDEWIHERTGIRERRFAGDGESTATIATNAAEAAIRDAGVSKDQIDLIILATITPEVPFPATACFVQDRLGLGTIPAFDISASCCGFVYALAIAANFVETGFYRHVLIVGADVMTRLVDFADRSTCVLFGDAAGAAVIGPAEREDQAILYARLSADGGRAPLIWAPGGGSREPTSQKTLNEKLHLVKMRGREVYKFAVTQMQEVMQDALEQSGLSLGEVAMVIPHQSNLRIIESARDKLNIPPEKMYINIHRTGNTSAASVPIALDELREAGRLRRGDVVVMVAFGAGLTWASSVVRL